MPKPPEERILVLRRGMILAPRQVFASGARALSRSDVLWTRKQWDGHVRQMERRHKTVEGIEIRAVEV